MDTPHVYEIRVEGLLTDRWSDWFGGLTVQNEPNCQTILTGRLSDQSALFGVLTKLHDLNLILISVLRVPNEAGLDRCSTEQLEIGTKKQL